jgi:hypothetical protein
MREGAGAAGARGGQGSNRWIGPAAALVWGILSLASAAFGATGVEIPLEGLGPGCIEEIHKGRTLELLLSSAAGESASVRWRGIARVNEASDGLLVSGLEQGGVTSWRIESVRVLRGTGRTATILGALLGGGVAVLLLDGGAESSDIAPPSFAKAGLFLAGSLVGAIAGSLLNDGLDDWERCYARGAEDGR